MFIILSVGAYSLTYERKFYSLFYKSPYEVILSDLEKVRAEFPDANALIDSHQKISRYYIQKNSFKSDFQWITDSLSTKQILHYLESASQSSDYIYLGALPEIQPNIVALILDYFPSLIWQKNYAGATTYFFSKKQEEIERPLIQTQFGSDYLSNWSNVILENLLIDSASQQINSYMVEPEIEWAVSYTDTLKNWDVGTNDFIDISLCGVFNQQPKDALVVASLTNSDGESIYWGSSNFLEFAKVDSFPQKITLHHTIKFSDIKGINSSLIFKTFVWNKGFNRFSIQDFIISKRKGNPVIYGLVEKIE